jgi:hypothetical protein
MMMLDHYLFRSSWGFFALVRPCPSSFLACPNLLFCCLSSCWNSTLETSSRCRTKYKDKQRRSRMHTNTDQSQHHPNPKESKDIKNYHFVEYTDTPSRRLLLLLLLVPPLPQPHSHPEVIVVPLHCMRPRVLLLGRRQSQSQTQQQVRSTARMDTEAPLTHYRNMDIGAPPTRYHSGRSRLLLPFLLLLWTIFVVPNPKPATTLYQPWWLWPLPAFPFPTSSS